MAPPQVDGSTSVETLKAILEAETGIPSQQQVILFGTRTLNNRCVSTTCEDGTTLAHGVGRGRGSSKYRGSSRRSGAEQVCVNNNVCIHYDTCLALAHIASRSTCKQAPSHDSVPARKSTCEWDTHECE